ncbi:MAG: hypothetical protein JSV22_06900 [Bacteroidales bacterium]|nr:MAG: hypothetical protein JSV22_06900 [Bacteroidales bacterium]
MNSLRLLNKREKNYIDRFIRKNKAKNIIGFVVFLILFLSLNGFYAFLLFLSEDSREQLLQPLIIIALAILNLAFVAGIIFALKTLSGNKLDYKYSIINTSGIFKSVYEYIGDEAKIYYYLNNVPVIAPHRLKKYLKNDMNINCEVAIINLSKTIFKNDYSIILSVDNKHYL